jgi:hypothetical protein
MRLMLTTTSSASAFRFVYWNKLFRKTYGLDLKIILSNEDEVLGSYRHAVSQLLPKATRIAWSLKKDEILKDQPSMTRKKFLYNLSRASYHRNGELIFVLGEICCPRSKSSQGGPSKSAAAQYTDASGREVI